MSIWASGGRVILAVIALTTLPACASRPDIVGHNKDAQEWAEAQRRQEAVAAKDAKADRWPHPVATPDPRSERPTAAPPARPRLSPATAANVSPSGRPSASSRALRLVGSATCFAIDEHGTLVTAHHVVRNSAALGVMFFGSDQVHPARVVRISEATDLAVLQIESAPPDFLPLGKPGSARVGLPVFTMGFPNPDLQGDEPKFTDGSISALSGVRTDAAWLQISVPIQPGNSGGPLVTDAGEVVGVVVHTARPSVFVSSEGALPQNVNWASKSENVRLLLSSRVAARAPTRSRQEAIERASKAVCLVGVFAR